MASAFPSMDDLRELSDEELVSRLGRTGDRASLGVLYERYRRRVLARAKHMTGDAAISEDLTQEVFLRLFRNAAKYKQQSAFAAWFKVLTYNVVIDEIRRHQRFKLEPLRTDTNPMPDHGGSYAEKVVFEKMYDRLMALLELVTTEEKALLLMKYRDDVPVRQIAERTGLGESAVKMRLRRARLKVLGLDASTDQE